MSDPLRPEIVTEVLLRAQVRTLTTCKCVSKQWRSIIDDPNFIKRPIDYTVKNNTNNILFLQADDDKLYELDLDAFGSDGNNPSNPPKNCGFSLLGSCNGLLCSRCEYNEHIFLANPSLNRHTWIVAFPSEFFETQLRFNADENWVYLSGYGFGYDCVNDEYKIVRIVQILGGDVDVDYLKSEVTICHLRAGAITNVSMPYLIRTTRKMGVYVSGALHWIMGRYDDLSSPNKIVAFDLSTHKFQELPQLNCINDMCVMIKNIGVLGSWLCGAASNLEGGNDVWVMKEYGVKESWTKLFSIPRNLLNHDSIRPLGFSKMGSKILLELDEKELAWYDWEKKSAVKVEIYGFQNEYFESVICLKSLVSPYLHGGCYRQHPQTERQPQRQSKGEGMNEKQQQPKEQKKKKDDFLCTGFKLKL